MRLQQYEHPTADLILQHLRAHPDVLVTSSQLPISPEADEHYRAHYAKTLNKLCVDKQLSEYDERMQGYFKKKAGSARIQFVSNSVRMLIARNEPVYAQSHGFMYVSSWEKVQESIDSAYRMISGRVRRIGYLQDILESPESTADILQSVDTLKEHMMPALRGQSIEKAVVYWFLAKFLYEHTDSAFTFRSFCTNIQIAVDRVGCENKHYSILQRAADSLCENDISEFILTAESMGVPVVSHKRTGVLMTQDKSLIETNIRNLKNDTRTRLGHLQRVLDQSRACFVEYSAYIDQITLSIARDIKSKLS